MIVNTRITPKVNKNGKRNGGIGYQHNVCGEVESRVTDGNGTYYWADGVDGNLLVDAKLAKRGGIFRGNGSKSFTRRVMDSQVNEFSRVKKIIENSEWEGFMIITSHPDAIPFFAQVIEEAGFDSDDVHFIIE